MRCGCPLAEKVFGVATVCAQHDITIGESDIGEREAGVFVNGLVEIGDGGIDIGGSALVPEIAALDVELIGVGVLRALFGDLLFFGAG